ncbi:MAG: hypothetical protein HYV07_03785 [Deltaproteobacteria bacterium]|nr:hypothetical protein [Deltaproteobacteria bacterium]
MILRRRALFAFVAMIPAACQDEPPPPTGSFLRPAGLAYVERTKGVLADLFVADSEAEGVRVVQLRRSEGEEGPVDEHTIVPAPAALFPLAMRAPGFPTRLALSDDAVRLYALAPAANAIHVLDVRPVPFGASASETDALVSLGTVELDTIGLGGFVAADLITLPGPASIDRLAIAGSSIDGTGMVATIDVAAGSAAVGATQTSTVPAAPRSLVRHGRELVVSSSETQVVSVARVRTATEAGALSAFRAVEVGGPTDALVDAEGVGVLAIRMDRPSVVVLEDGPLGLMRSERAFASVYAADEDLGAPDAVGRIDLRGPRVVAGSAAMVDAFPDPEDIAADLLGGRGLAVILLHSDARVSFLLGPDLRIVALDDARVKRLSERAGRLEVQGCTLSEVPVCKEEDDPTSVPAEPVCEPGSLTAPRDKARRLTIEFRGRVAGGRTGTLSPDPEGFKLMAEGVDLSAVRPGDLVRIALRPRVRCDANDRIDIVSTGTVTDAGEDLTVAFSGLAIPRCPTDPLELLEFDVRPAEREMVSTEVDDEGGFDHVLERVRTTSTSGSESASVTFPVRLTMTSTSPFRCVAAGPRACWTHEDCRSAECVAATAKCPGTCGVCLPPSCLELEPIICSGLDVEVTAGRASVLDPSLSRAFLPALPDRVVFSAMRTSWFTSFPGARGLAETIVDPTLGHNKSFIR